MSLYSYLLVNSTEHPILRSFLSASFPQLDAYALETRDAMRYYFSEKSDMNTYTWCFFTFNVSYLEGVHSRTFSFSATNWPLSS